MWSERMRKNFSSKDLSSIIAQKRSCSTVHHGMARTIRRTHTSPPSGYRSLSLAVTGERLSRSDRIPINGTGDKITYSPTGSGSRNEQKERARIAVLRRQVCHRYCNRVPDQDGKEERHGPVVHGPHGARGAKEQRSKRHLY